MPDNDIRYSLATDGIPDLEDLWAEDIAKYESITKDENKKSFDEPPQIEENKMKKKNKLKKTQIIIIVYIFLIITELFFYVPYHSIRIFRTKQNVPHTEIIGNGYASMEEIAGYVAVFDENAYTSTKGKIVNTPQIIINVSITTILAIAIYFLMQKNQGVAKTQDATTNGITFTDEELNDMPVLDVNSLAFAIEEEIIQAQRDYARQMAKYVIKKGVQNV